MAKLILILLLALVLEAVGVVFLSQGLREIGESKQLSPGEIARLLGRGITNGRFLLGLLMETAFFFLLLAMLKRWDVSLIWPLTSLGFVFTTLAAKFMRHEQVSAMRWSGVLLIMVGAALVGCSEKFKTRPAVSAKAADANVKKE